MNYCTQEELKAFEQTVVDLWERGELPFLTHLCGGNESQLIDIFSRIKEGDWVFSTHRNHYHALLAGINPANLIDKIKLGGSMFTFNKSRNFYSSSILAGSCCIAAGVALALQEEQSDAHVWCFLGDGAEEEGHFYEAVMMVAGHDLPCTFVIEDNNRSVDTTLQERMPTEFRMTWPDCVLRYSYEPIFPHAGNGTPKLIIFDSTIKPSAQFK